MVEKKVDPEFELFAEAHALYVGRKRYVTTEFKNLKAQHKDWKEILPLLKGAIQNQIAWREQKAKTGEFTPEWKQFSNWVKEQYWEYEFPLVKNVHYSVNGDKIPHF